MSIDFPNSPTNGQQYSSAGYTWTYVSPPGAWIGIGGGGTPVGGLGAVVEDLAPKLGGNLNLNGFTINASTGTISNLTKSMVGLANVDNTSDVNKPVSTATQTALNGKANTSHTHAVVDVTGLQAALDLKAPLASPVLTGTPVSPTATAGTNTNQIATTAFVTTAVAASPGVPTGTVLDFAGASPPAGYLMCDGAAVSRTVYAALFAIIGGTYGAGDGSTTFNVPDCRARTVVGAGGSGSLYTWTLNAKQGAEHHYLTIDQMPLHGHPVANSNTSQSSANCQTSGGFMKNTGGVVAAPANNTTTCNGTNYNQVAAAGGGNWHPIVQPSIGLNKIIKT